MSTSGIDHLRRQDSQAKQDLTVIADGGDKVRAHAERITVLRQLAQGLMHHGKEAGTQALDRLRLNEWSLWHGLYQSEAVAAAASQSGSIR